MDLENMAVAEDQAHSLVRVLKNWFGPLTTSTPWLTTVHLLLDLPIGIATFTIVVTFLSVGGGLAITIVGIPLLAATVIGGRAIAVVERERAKVFLGKDLISPTNFDFSKITLGTMWSALKDKPGWKGLFYGLIALPVGIFNFTVAITLWSVAISSTFCVFGLPFLRGSDNSLVNWNRSTGHWRIVQVNYYSGWVIGLFYLGVTLFGLLLLALTPRIIMGLATLKEKIVRSLCTPGEREQLSQRVNQLEETRSASVVGSANELRRIERDLHDGAQQHLVSVAMQLGIAKERLADGGDPAVADMVDSAHRDAKAAIAELRNLVRGIHPSVLTDRGLDAAISALAARSTVPVEIKYELTQRLPQTSETTAYFVVAEALTNIAKHSDASRCTVRLFQEASRVFIEVADDGKGGAYESQVGGLRGLHDRVRAIDGTIQLSSPVGGPTRILVELPCV